MFCELVVVEFWQYYASTNLAYVLLGVGLYVIVLSFFVKGRTISALFITGVIDWFALSALFSLAAFIFWSADQRNLGREYSFFDLWVSSAVSLSPLILATLWRSKFDKGKLEATGMLLMTLLSTPILAIAVVGGICVSQGIVASWKSYHF